MLDGYSAPLTAGNFVRNVLEGAYTNAELKVDQGAVLAGGGYAGGECLPRFQRTPPPEQSTKINALESAHLNAELKVDQDAMVVSSGCAGFKNTTV